MKWKEWLYQATARLSMSSKSARYDSEVLLMQVTGVNKSKLLGFDDTMLTYEQQKVLEKLLCRREKGEPIAYLIGKCTFWTIQLHISKAVFIPRPDTEHLIQTALNLLPYSKINVLDLGTGSGAIALALASERPKWKITGTDFSSNIISIANDNAARLRINNVKFMKSDWFNSLSKKKYHLIVSNPPYIDRNDPHLRIRDIQFEPYTALVSNQYGLGALSMICDKAHSYLIPGGWLILEHGWNQGASVRKLLYNSGFCKISTIRDYGGNERVSIGIFPECSKI